LVVTPAEPKTSLEKETVSAPCSENIENNTLISPWTMEHRPEQLVRDEDVARLLSMGYDAETARNALIATGGYIELAISFLHRQTNAAAAAASTDVQTLVVGMGFDEDRAREALRIENGDVERAVHLILSGNDPTQTSSRSERNPVLWAARSAQNWAQHDDDENVDDNVVLGQFHQHSIGQQEGRSACTCIAMTAAKYFLDKTFLKDDGKVTQCFLSQAVARGIEHYQQIHNSDSSVEHMSAEEVLRQDAASTKLFAGLHLTGAGVRQGFLSEDANHPMGLGASLTDILKDHTLKRGAGRYVCVLITKTPETVLVCLPLDDAHHRDRPFWLIDSHPRPHLGLANSYAKMHASLDDLLLSLYTLFPPMADLGPDVPEMMLMMYNSFDLYPFVGRDQE
jgi:hypothetical protein